MDMFAADPLVEEKRVEEERFASAHLPGEIPEPFPEAAFPEEMFAEEESPAPLPGAVPVPSAGGAAAGLARRYAGSPVHLASVVPPSWNRRHMLLAGAAVIALGAVGIGLCTWPGTPAPPPPQQAGAAGVRSMPLAPSAALARVPTTSAEPLTRQKYAAQRQDQQLQQLLALRGGDAASAALASDREGPSGRDQPPSGYVASEPGANRESSSAARLPSLAVASASPVAVGMPASAREPSPPRAATPTVIPDPAAGVSAAPPKPSAPPRADMPADPVKTASILQPGPMTTADQVQVLEVVTQMAAMVRDLRAEQAQQRTDFAKAEGDMAARLTDFERRLALAEAGRAMAVARAAGAPPAATATLAATVAATAPASPASSPGQNAAAAGSTPPVQVTPAAARGAPASDKGAAKRYRVQAASPGLALLAEIDRGGGDGAQLQILVGDTIPGYGKVAAIGQRGTAWVVTTEHGDIQ